MIRVSDYITKKLADKGVDTVFMVTGGGAMFLNDSIAKEKRIKYICNHHEQACAMAAEGYSRVSGKLGVINVTTGPGGINALNGVYGAWTDSIPMLILSGQVKRETYIRTYDALSKLRQLGDQEADIVSMVKGITKYAVTVTDPETIRYHLEKAIYLAETGRPGPVWLDIPIDIQSSMVSEGKLKGFKSEKKSEEEKQKRKKVSIKCDKIVKMLGASKRPVLMVGSGVRLAKAETEFNRIVSKLKIPTVPAWTALDLIATDNKYYCGRPGTVGDRAGNFTVQNSDLIIIVGCRLSIRQISYNSSSFARNAYKVYVDVDKEEFKKPYLSMDMDVLSDAKLFFEELEKAIERSKFNQKFNEWLDWCKQRLIKYPVLSKKQKTISPLNPYYFFDVLFKNLPKNSITTCSNGAASVMPFQVGQIKDGQRLFTNAGSASLGYDLPAAIGAIAAAPKKDIICLAGDGSIQFNLQELQTIVYHKMPIKIFVIDNNGYLSIRTTQNNFFDGRFIGESDKSGLSFPDIIKIGKAYGFQTEKIGGRGFERKIKKVLASKLPVIAHVIVDPKQPVEPKLSSKRLPNGQMVSAELEDMFPFLDREEFETNLFSS